MNAYAKEIREAINENFNGRGPAVIGMDRNTCQHRIFDARVHKGIIQGKALNSGKWFTLAGYWVGARVRNMDKVGA
jgi:hypothetical protein